MNAAGYILVLGAALSFSVQGEESGARRLEQAQAGMAGASWPRKPDDRLSPLSGKMKDTAEISPRFYGKEKEFRAKSASGWQKEAGLVSKNPWQGPAGQGWEEARWNQNRAWSGDRGTDETFHPSRELAKEQALAHRELEPAPAPDWSTRSARLGMGREGSLPMYAGRLTRVRQQVWQGEEKIRDLGAGRQEKFSPSEVEKMLSRPVGELRGAAREQPAVATPLAAADN